LRMIKQLFMKHKCSRRDPRPPGRSR